MLTLTHFSMQRPDYEIDQGRALHWLSEVHARSEATARGLNEAECAAFLARYRRLIEHSACGPARIAARGHVLADLGSTDWPKLALYDVTKHPRGQGTASRSRLFAEIVNAYFGRAFADETLAPSELIHVTCTGYVSPSGAQRLVADKAWGSLTQVTHAYHMGCYAAFPAIRMALGHFGLPRAWRPAGAARRVDLVHTELCTLHLDPSDHSAEQCVVQSLFGDGFVRYSLIDAEAGPGLSVLSLSELLLPDSAEAMAWSAGDFGMHMTLARDVPERIAGTLRVFVSDLLAKAGASLADLRESVVAVHPGGPKIIDRVCAVLELDERQVAISRQVLLDYGNMSSATLPHIWLRLVADDQVRSGTLVVSLAFGPGLTVAGGVFRKR